MESIEDPTSPTDAAVFRGVSFSHPDDGQRSHISSLINWNSFNLVQIPDESAEVFFKWRKLMLATGKSGHRERRRKNDATRLKLKLFVIYSFQGIYSLCLVQTCTASFPHSSTIQIKYSWVALTYLCNISQQQNVSPQNLWLATRCNVSSGPAHLISR